MMMVDSHQPLTNNRLQARQFRIHNDMIATARASVDCHNKRAIQRRRNYKLEQMREGGETNTRRVNGSSTPV